MKTNSLKVIAVAALLWSGSTMQGALCEPAESKSKAKKSAAGKSGGSATQEEWQKKYDAESSNLWRQFDKGQEEGRKACTRLMELSKNAFPGKPIEYSRALNIVAIRCMADDLYGEADKALKLASSALKKDTNADAGEQGKLLSNQGRLDVATGKYKPARKLLLDAMNARAGDFKGYANTKGNLGKLDMLEENYSDAEKVLTETIAYRDEHGTIGGKFIESSENLTDLAQTELALHKPHEAIAAAERALQVRKDVDPNTVIVTPYEQSSARPLSIIARAQNMLDDRSAADASMDKALKAAAELTPPNHEIADTYANVGELLIEKGRKAEGIEYLQKALDMRSSIYGRSNVIVQRTRKRLSALQK